MSLLLFCLLLPLSSALLVNLNPGGLLTYQDCDGNVICLVQKSCLVPDSTEFRTLIRWSGKIRGNLTNCTGIRFSQMSVTDDNLYKFRLQLQTRWRMEDSSDMPFYASFTHDYRVQSFGLNVFMYDCFEYKENAKSIENNITSSFFQQLNQTNFALLRIDEEFRFNDNTILCDAFIRYRMKKSEIPRFQTRMRIKTEKEFFTYENDDFWEIFDEMIVRDVGEPLTKQFIHYCILILLVYSITVYFLDRYCRRLQFTTVDREEMEEHFFPPARYRNKLNHFRMLRGLTTIEKEKNLAAVPEDILIDFEN